jgi:hypothetical protein
MAVDAVLEFLHRVEVAPHFYFTRCDFENGGSTFFRNVGNVAHFNTVQTPNGMNTTLDISSSEISTL